jgi:hypothetical protein
MASVRLGRYEVEDYELPRVCMRCGARAVGYRLRRFRWCPPWVLVAIPFGLLPYIIISEVLTKRMPVRVPHCEEHKKNPLWPTLVSVGILLGLIAISIGLTVVLDDFDETRLICAVGVLLFIMWMFAAMIIHTPAIRPTEITDKSITLKGVSEEFVKALEADRRGEVEEAERDRPRSKRRERDEDDRPRARRRGRDDGGGYYDPDRRRRRGRDEDEDYR